MQNGDIYYLNKSKIHSYKGPCYYNGKFKSPYFKINNYYALNGVIIPEKDFIIYNRYVKVNELIKKTNDTKI